jgi:hypothetical protein
MFTGMPKIPRYSRECIVSEKIDGTNAQVFIWDELYQPKKSDGTLGDKVGPRPDDVPWIWERENLSVAAGSKSRYVTTDNDNFKFAGWVLSNAENLLLLGHGLHFGEWWGQGIQRGYGLKEKRFSLFNVTRWHDNPNLPLCCYVVPIITRGILGELDLNNILHNLAVYGSHAAPGYMNPEGIVIYHTQGNWLFKKTIKNDNEPKGKII